MYILATLDTTILLHKKRRIFKHVQFKLQSSVQLYNKVYKFTSSPNGDDHTRKFVSKNIWLMGLGAE